MITGFYRLTILIGIILQLSCSINQKDKENADDFGKFYYSLQKIELFDMPNGKIIKIMEKGETFFLSSRHYSNQTDKWQGIHFDYSNYKNIYYIKKNNDYYGLSMSRYVFPGVLFQVPSRKGANICKEPYEDSQPPRNSEKCDEVILKLPYLSYFTATKTYYMNTGIWLKMHLDGIDGYVHESRVLPAYLYNNSTVEDFIKKIKEICHEKKQNGQHLLQCRSKKNLLTVMPVMNGRRV